MSAPAPVLGSGDHTYEVQQGWGQLPASIQYGYTHGVVCDSQHRILIHNQSHHAMVLFDEHGTLITSWGEEYAAGAHGMTLVTEGNDEFVILSDQARKIVVKHTLDGAEVMRLPFPAQPGVYSSPEQYVPTNVAVAPNGDIYVGDGYGLSYIHHYNRGGEWLQTWGGLGTEPGRMNCPHGLWVDTRTPDRPVLVVADRGNRRLQLFTLAGEHIGFVTDELRHPCHFWQHQDELVIPDLFGRVTLFDKAYRLIAHLGDNPGVETTPGYPNLPPEQRIPGKFISPHAACTDPEGNIYVVEWVSDGRVTRLKKV